MSSSCSRWLALHTGNVEDVDQHEPFDRSPREAAIMAARSRAFQELFESSKPTRQTVGGQIMGLMPVR